MGRYWAELSLLKVFARLHDDATIEQARDEMSAIAAQVREEHSEYREAGFDMSVVPLLETVVGNVRSTLLLLMGAVGFVLLIACVNIVGLMLVRAQGRQREILLRLALGWPPHAQAHDPMDWVLEWGRYDEVRWRRGWQVLFDTHELVHNRREILRIVVSNESNGALAVVDVNTLWRRADGNDFHWLGRAGKIYSKVGSEWKLIAHTGLLEYPPRAH